LAETEKLSTFNAHDDRVANAFTFRNACRRGQHCIIPASATTRGGKCSGWRGEPGLCHARTARL